MNEMIRNLLKKQAQWQKSRKELSWEEKVRMIERVKDDVARWLPAYRKGTAATPKSESDPK
jgi:hypothetical protein